MTQESPANDERAIRELVATWMAASRAGNTAKVLSLMADDVVFQVPGREPFGKELVVQRGETLTLAAPLRETGRRKAVPYVLTGAGLLAAGAITTSIFAIARDSHASDLRDSLARHATAATTPCPRPGST